MSILGRLLVLYELCTDFTKKCNDDHVAAFGSMSAFFMLLSMFPFMIFFLTLTQYLPYTKDDVINLFINVFPFEKKAIIISVVNEIYQKTATSVFTLSIIAALWASSKGMYSIIKGLNSVYDIEDDRNYFVVRIFSMVCTAVFAAMVLAMLVLWVFGNMLYQFLLRNSPVLASIATYLIHKRTVVTVLTLTFVFMVIYRFLPDRKSSFFKQWPGALVAAFSWIIFSVVCSMFMEGFTSFTFLHGSMASIMILLLWLYFCMSMIFYGAEVNYFLENKKNYHTLVLILRHNRRDSQRKRERLRRKKEKELQEKELLEKESREESTESGSIEDSEGEKDTEYKENLNRGEGLKQEGG